MGGYKWPKLKEVMAHMGISQRAVRKFSKHLFFLKRAKQHDSRFDVAATCLIVKHGVPTKDLNSGLQGYGLLSHEIATAVNPTPVPPQLTPLKASLTQIGMGKKNPSPGRKSCCGYLDCP